MTQRFELPYKIPYRCGVCGKAWFPYDGSALCMEEPLQPAPEVNETDARWFACCGRLFRWV